MQTFCTCKKPAKISKMQTFFARNVNVIILRTFSKLICPAQFIYPSCTMKYQNKSP